MRGFHYVMAGASAVVGIFNTALGAQGHWVNAFLGALNLAVAAWSFNVARKIA